MNCRCEGARGTCPHTIECPACHAGPWKPCKRPSGHSCSMHAERYRKSEMDDAARCLGFEPMGEGCRHCSGLPEDHLPKQGSLF